MSAIASLLAGVLCMSPAYFAQQTMKAPTANQITLTQSFSHFSHDVPPRVLLLLGLSLATIVEAFELRHSSCRD
jgi:hypothetical protein